MVWRTCEVEECENKFVPQHYQQKYCRPQHQYLAAARRRRLKIKSGQE